ncbi:MAG: hypothetical protein HWE24_18885 [Oceanospirillaceae bacterium]|nr:hypothetical protein [Oceanospirillaceae bacterium]
MSANLDQNINHINKTQQLNSKVKNKLAPLAMTLCCAIIIHLVIFTLSDQQDWFTIKPQTANFELILLPEEASPSNTTPKAVIPSNDKVEKKPTEKIDSSRKVNSNDIETKTAGAQPNNTLDSGLNGKQLSEQEHTFNPEETLDSIKKKPTTDSLFETEGNTSTDFSLSSQKPELLDLSKLSLSANINDTELTKVFSKELRHKISESQKAQKEYLKGIKEEEQDYPVTRDADGTRYVNIKGVCWRLPKEGSNEGWAIVFDGCGIKSKLFHFELNISPSVLTNELLSPDSPFYLDQQSN